MKTTSKKVSISLLTFFTLFFINAVYASDFNILPSTDNFGLKQEFSVNIKIDSGDDVINAAQGKISFNPNILEIKNISKAAVVKEL